jgi:hypothetical protein
MEGEHHRDAHLPLLGGAVVDRLRLHLRVDLRKENVVPEGKIVIVYRSIDRCYMRREFRTLVGAQKFAHQKVGPHPDRSETFRYAVSDDGVGKVEVSGATLSEIFPEKV